MTNTAVPCRAFSLIEMILVVLLIGIVTSLLMPALAAARDSARDTISLGHLRSHAQVLGAYAGDWDEFYPAFADPDATLSVVRGCGTTHTFLYFESVIFWNIALCEGYYSESLKHKSFWHPARKTFEDGIFDTDYLLSSAFYAAPSYWDAKTRRGREQLGPSRLSSVVYPASKAVVVELHPARGLPTHITQEGIAMSFADGSAGRFSAEELQAPYAKGDEWLPVGVFGMHTIRGWAGRDR